MLSRYALKGVLVVVLAAISLSTAFASQITDPNDPRTWQGASVGTFAQLYYGSNTLANRQLVVNNYLLDDGIFNATGYTAATLISNYGGGGCLGFSTGVTPGDYNYGCGAGPLALNANSIDNLWFQSDGVVGQTVFDLGFQAVKAAVFPIVDHGPLPQETIESTVYLSNDLVTWTQAVVERVWLEGHLLGPDWDGFVYAVGTGSSNTFRYASIIHGGPSALVDDGDDEINGLMGLQANFTQVPEPTSILLVSLGLGGLGFIRKKMGL